MALTAAPPAERPRTVLVVEDEPSLAQLLRETLGEAGFRVAVLDDGSDVADWVRAHGPDAVLLDLGLPGKDGLAVCHEIRAFSTVPLIMVTGRIEEMDRLRGLEIGADDYICKPFTPKEVLARVRALLRRSIEWREAQPGSPLSLDEAGMAARWNGIRLDLTPVEFRGRVWFTKSAPATVGLEEYAVGICGMENLVRIADLTVVASIDHEDPLETGEADED